jgi:Domain of unknown function (DUF4276)
LSRLRVFPIVEGHGEDQSIRILLQRIWYELLGGEHLEVLKAFRGKRTKIGRALELGVALDHAVTRLRDSEYPDPSMVLILLDADEDLPCLLGPDLLARAQSLRGDADISCVIANVEYETWFVAAAESLSRFLDLSQDALLPEAPEESRQGKGWIQRRKRNYTPVVDQPAMTRAMDLELCRRRSPSFDKLCRELQSRLETGRTC